MRRRHEMERAATAAKAAVKTRALLDRLTAASENHPYLAGKEVEPGPCRVTCNGALVVPVTDARTGELQSLQFIRPDGEKRFLAGGRAAGGCCELFGPKPTLTEVDLDAEEIDPSVVAALKDPASPDDEVGRTVTE